MIEHEPVLEQRYGRWIVVDQYGGTRMASRTEIQLWQMIQQLRRQLQGGSSAATKGKQVRKLFSAVGFVVMLGAQVQAATVIQHVSSDVTISFDATGACSGEAQTINAIDQFDYRLWDTGKISVRETLAGTDTADASGRTLGKIQNQMNEVGIIYPFSGRVSSKESLTCKGSGKVFSFVCSYDIGADGVVTVRRCS